MVIDLKNGYIRPGDEVTMFISQKYEKSIDKLNIGIVVPLNV